MDSNTLTLLITTESRRAISEVNNMAKAFDNASKSATKVESAIKRAFNQSSILGFYTVMKNLVNDMGYFAKAQAEYVENLNLMDTAFGKNRDSAHALLNEMSDIFGLDTSRLTKQLGTYRQMASAMSLASDTADLLSKNLIKMQEDVSSLYNLDPTKVATKLQSAMAGQSRAVRSLGVDITTTGLQNELYRRGIDMTVDSLNSASKEVLIYLTMEHQLRNAQGDLAKTSESVANQMRIFKDEVSMLARNLGGLLIPILKEILPLLNGILMAINSIIKSLLVFLGIDAESLGSEFGITEVDTGFDDLTNSIDNTTKAAKEAKKSLRGFDKLNAIYTPTSTGSSGTGGVGGGAGYSTTIPKELLDALKEYDNKMEGLKTKAQEIRDIILEIIEPLTKPIGEGLTYLWEHVLQPMGEWAKTTLLPAVVDTLKSTFNALGKITKDVVNPALKFLLDKVITPLGRLVGKTVVKAFENWKDVMDLIAKSKILTFLLGSVGLVVGFQKLFTAAKNVVKVLGKTQLLGTLLNYDDALLGAIRDTKSLKKGWENFVGAVTTGKNKLDKINSSISFALQGIVEEFAGITIASASFDDASENGLNFFNVLGQIIGALLAVKGGIEVVTGVVGIFSSTLAANPLTAVIGALVGAGGLVASLALTKDKFKESDDKVDESKQKLEEYKKKVQETRDEIETSSTKLQIQTEQSEKYRDELMNLIDDNGKVKGSYQDVDTAIGFLNTTLGTNITRKQDQLYWDGQIIDKRDDLNSKIDDTINKLKEESIQAIANKAIQSVLERQIDIRKEENDVIKDLQKDAKNYDLTNEDEAKNFYSRNEKKIKKLADLQSAYKQNEDQMQLYSQAVGEAQQGNFDQAIDHMSTTAKKSKTEISDIMNKIDSTLDKTYSTKIILEVEADTKKWEKAAKEWKKKNPEYAGIMSYPPPIPSTPKYAGGGFPEDGLFFANHNEMVGKFSNGKNVVANNNQIVSGITAGVRTAILSTRKKDSQNVNIQVTADDDSFARFLKFKTNQDDRQFGY